MKPIREIELELFYNIINNIDNSVLINSIEDRNIKNLYIICLNQIDESISEDAIELMDYIETECKYFNQSLDKRIKDENLRNLIEKCINNENEDKKDELYDELYDYVYKYCTLDLYDYYKKICSSANSDDKEDQIRDILIKNKIDANYYDLKINYTPLSIDNIFNSYNKGNTVAVRILEFTEWSSIMNYKSFININNNLEKIPEIINEYTSKTEKLIQNLKNKYNN